MNGLNTATQYRPPRSIDSMVEAFREHCHDGGRDFIDYLNDWHKSDALETINDAVQNYTPERAIGIIKKALEELFEIAAQGHREALEGRYRLLTREIGRGGGLKAAAPSRREQH